WKDISALTSAIRKNGVTRRHSSHVSFGICLYWLVLLRLVRITEMNSAAHTTNRNSLNVMTKNGSRRQWHISKVVSRRSVSNVRMLKAARCRHVIASTLKRVKGVGRSNE